MAFRASGLGLSLGGCLKEGPGLGRRGRRGRRAGG